VLSLADSSASVISSSETEILGIALPLKRRVDDSSSNCRRHPERDSLVRVCFELIPRLAGGFLASLLRFETHGKEGLGESCRIQHVV